MTLHITMGPGVTGATCLCPDCKRRDLEAEFREAAVELAHRYQDIHYVHRVHLAMSSHALAGLVLKLAEELAAAQVAPTGLGGNDAIRAEAEAKGIRYGLEHAGDDCRKRIAELERKEMGDGD